MRKSIFLFFLIAHVATSSAQETTVSSDTIKLVRGIYFTEKSFINKTPDLVTPFIVDSNYVRKESGGIITYGNTFRFVDSSIILENDVFGFYDGKDMYVQLDFEGFFKFRKFGRHPYILVRRGLNPLLLLNPFDPSTPKINLASIAFSAFNINNLDLHFYGSKRKLILATPEGIGFLLKKDKDLFEAYGNESSKSNKVMMQYLDKLNERYPNW